MPNICKPSLWPETRIIGLIFIFSLFLLVGKQGNQELVFALEEGTGFTISSDKAVYVSGEPIVMSLTVFNHSGSDTTFHFNSSQRYDFFIQGHEGKEVWRWSKGRAFGMMLGEESLGPSRTEATYSEVFKGPLKPGLYTVVGLLADVEASMSGEITIEIKE